MSNERSRVLAAEGALIPVQVADPDGLARPLTCTFLVDTGAEMTVISPETAHVLELATERRAEVAGIVRSTPRRVRFHTVCLILAGKELEVEACALPRDDDVVDGLLGRDALAHLRFTYDGPAGTFTIE